MIAAAEKETKATAHQFYASRSRSPNHLSLRTMPKPKELELSPAEQFKRFREAAKKAEVTRNEGEFELAFKTVAHQKPAAHEDRPRRRRASKTSSR